MYPFQKNILDLYYLQLNGANTEIRDAGSIALVACGGPWSPSATTRRGRRLGPATLSGVRAASTREMRGCPAARTGQAA